MPDDERPILPNTEGYQFETSGDPSHVVTTDEYLNHAGFRSVGVLISLGSGLALFTYASLLTWLSLVLSVLSCRWSLDESDIMTIKAFVLVGVMTGAPLAGMISDKVGRRYVVLFGSYFAIFFWLLVSVTSSGVWFGILAFFTGLGFGILVPSAVVFAFEYTSYPQHTRLFLLLFMMYFLGEVYALGLYYLVVKYIGWRWLTVLVALPLALLITFFHLTPDSLNFLNISGRKDHCYLILLKIHNKQGVPMKQGTLLSIENDTRGECSLIFGKKYLKQTLLLSAVFFLLTLTYYLMEYSLTLSFMQGRCGIPPPTVLGCQSMSDRAVARALFDVLPEVGAVWVAMFLSEAFTRKLTMGTLTIVAAGCTIAGLICFGVVLFLVEMSIARACVISVLVVEYMYSLEIYPTACRATEFSLLWSVGVLGAIVSIFIGYAFQKSITALLIVVGVLLVIVLLPMFFLPKDVKDIDEGEVVPLTH